jgi:pseudouridine synthase
METRLNKFLARSGIASRRDADRLIEEGRVSVNGRVALKLGTKIVEGKDTVTVDGRTVRRIRQPVYLALNKPRGVLVTLSDPFDRTTIRHLLPSLPDGVFPVGRLDKDSEGLLILTNDGELSFHLTHPRFEVPKKYIVRIKGEISEDEIRRLEKGISLDGRKTVPARVGTFDSKGRRGFLEIEIREGRKREVRRMLRAVGHEVVSLKRTSFAGLSLGHLPSGRWRHLKDQEVRKLRERAGLDA